MNNSYDISDMNQNSTDRVGSPPILNPKGTNATRLSWRNSRPEILLESEGGPKAPPPPASKKKGSGNQCSPPS